MHKIRFADQTNTTDIDASEKCPKNYEFNTLRCTTPPCPATKFKLVTTLFSTNTTLTTLSNTPFCSSEQNTLIPHVQHATPASQLLNATTVWPHLRRRNFATFVEVAKSAESVTREQRHTARTKRLPRAVTMSGNKHNGTQNERHNKWERFSKKRQPFFGNSFPHRFNHAKYSTHAQGPTANRFFFNFFSKQERRIDNDKVATTGWYVRGHRVTATTN